MAAPPAKSARLLHGVVAAGLWIGPVGCGADVDDCPVPLPDFGTLQLVSCRPADPDSEPTTPATMRLQSSCELSPTATVEQRYPDNSINPVLVLTRSEGPSLWIRPELRTRLGGPDYGGGGTIACDEQTFYLGHPVLGTLLAYDIEGKERWRFDPPGFRSLEEKDDLVGAPVTRILEALLADSSYLTRVFTSGPYVLVETRTGGLGHMHFVVDGDGKLVTQVGPWDGIVRSSIHEGWEFVAGGGLDPKSYQGTTVIELTYVSPQMGP